MKYCQVFQQFTRTSLRPDLVWTSDSTKQVVQLELTVPWEDRMEEAHERKKAKYLQMVEACRESGSSPPVGLPGEGVWWPRTRNTLWPLGPSLRMCPSCTFKVFRNLTERLKWILNSVCSKSIFNKLQRNSQCKWIERITLLGKANLITNLSQLLITVP